jgi:hypothetical protein
MSARRPAIDIAVSFLLATICVSLGSLRAQGTPQNPAVSHKLLPLSGTRTPVGATGLPVALLPVLNADADAVRMLRQSGVNYSKITFRGATALEIAKRIGDPALIDALGDKQTDL